MRKKLPLCIVLVAVCMPPLLRADTVIRKDESQIECLVTSPPCPTCRGEQTIKCPVCNGSGRIKDETCPRCNGQRNIPCPTCAGLGFVGEEINIMARGGIRMSIPAVDIAQIVKKKGAEADFLPPKVSYRNKAAEVPPNEAKANMELAQWALGVGLVEEAQVHFIRAKLLDPALTGKVDSYLTRIRSEREKKVRDTVSKALALITKNRMDEAKSALEDVVSKNPDSELVRSPALQKEVISTALGPGAERWGAALQQVIANIDTRLRMLCPVCSGTGSVKCTQCNGTGDAECQRCRGTGTISCPDCNGTGKQLCPRCFGTGRVKVTVGVAGEASGPCPLCNGAGTIRCQTCGANGKAPCPECKGTGKLKGACPICKGTGRQSCTNCLGTGLRAPENYKWGPFPVLPPGSAAGTGPVGFQGKVGAAVITVLPSEILYGGRFSLYLDKRLGEKHTYMLVCVDNRDGNKLLKFDAGGRSLRMVTPDAKQIEMLPPTAVLQKLQATGASKELLAVITPGDVLPGVVKYFVTVFPGDSAPKPGTRVFWGTDEIWELDLVDARTVQPLR